MDGAMRAAYDKVERKKSVAEKYCNHHLIAPFANLTVYIYIYS